MIDELPKGWATASVADVIEDFQPGFASGQKDVEGGIAQLRMNNIGVHGELVLDLVRTVPEKLVRPQHALRLGDVLVCTTNSAKLVGKCAYFDLSGRYVFSNHLTRLRPNREVVDGRFLRWNLWQHWKSGAFDDKCKHWVNQSAIPRDALLEAEVSVPPIREQQRIVTKLGKLFEKVDVCQTRLSRISILLKRFRQSILAAAADGRLTSDLRHKGSAEWEEKALGEVLTAIEAGKSFACEERPPHGSHEIGVLKVSAVSWGIFDENESKTCLDPAMVRKEYFVHKGDLLLSRANTIELVGAVAIVSKLTKRLMLSDKTLRLKVKGVSPEWVLYCLRSDSGRGQIESLATGNQQSMRNIGQGSIRAIRIPIPPEDEQREIVRRVEALFNMADRIEARFTKACAQIDKLTPSLLAKAFRGELVPTEADLAEVEGRAFESATQLLARIKSSSKPDSRNGIDPHRIRGSGARLGR